MQTGGTERADGGADSLAVLLPLFRELNGLKRIRVAGKKGSWAERLFLRAWGRLVAGEEPGRVAYEEIGGGGGGHAAGGDRRRRSGRRAGPGRGPAGDFTASLRRGGATARASLGGGLARHFDG